MGRANISVVIPTYNRCDRLGKALRAVCSQDVDGLEVIVVDNNSRDDTPRMVRDYPDKRVRYERCTRQGIYHTLNHGFAATTGALLTWTSDDNWYHDRAVADMQSALKDSGADFVYSDYLAFYEDEGTTKTVAVCPPSKLDEVAEFIGPCFLFKRRVYERIGPHSLRYRWSSDYDYWLRVYRSGFVMQPMPSARYTFVCHKQAVTSSRTAAVFAEACRIRLAHGCYARHWKSSGRDPADSWQDISLLVRGGFLPEAMSLTAQIIARRPWNLAAWRKCWWAFDNARPKHV